MLSRIEDNPNMSVICFGGEDWWYHNRGHIDMQLMRRFAQNGTVVYVNSIVMQKPGLGHGKKFVKKLVRKSKSIFNGLKMTDAGFWAYSPFTLPVHHISWARPFNEALLRYQILLITHKLDIELPIVWVGCPAACETAIKMKKSKLVYQRTDRFEEFPNIDSEIIRSYDRTLKSNADLTVFVNKKLYQAEHSQCKNALYLDHGVDYEMFSLAEKSKHTPFEFASIKRPVIGFFGGIDNHTFDITLTEQVVDRLPEMSFVFIGNSSIDCSRLAERKNVWMLGQRPYSRIPHYGKCFDVAIMPWQQNGWIQFCNPVKLKEYLALGKPVVSTPFAELEDYLDVVYQAQNPAEFAGSIKKAIAEDSFELAAVRRKKIEGCSWETKARIVMTNLFGTEIAFSDSDDG